MFEKLNQRNQRTSSISKMPFCNLLNCIAAMIAVAVFVAPSSKAAETNPAATNSLLAEFATLANEEGSLLSEMQANVRMKETIERDIADIAQRRGSLNKEITDLNAFCQGEYNDSEYARRKKICDEKGVIYGQQLAALETEQKAIDARKADQATAAQALIGKYKSLKSTAKAKLEELRGVEAFAGLVKECELLNTIGKQNDCIQKGYASMAVAPEAPILAICGQQPLTNNWKFATIDPKAKRTVFGPYLCYNACVIARSNEALTDRWLMVSECDNNP